ALLVFFEKVEQLAQNGDAELEQQVRAISLAWHDAMEEGFLENQYNYISRLGSEDRARRQECIGLLKEGQTAMEKGGKGDEAQYDEAQKKFLLAARGFDEVKDAYHAAQAYHWLARVFDPESRPKGADPRRAVEFYRQALERYEAIDHRGARVRVIRSREQKLVTEGHDPDKPPAAAPTPEAPGKPAAGGGGKTDDPAAGTSRFAPGSEWVAADLAFGVSAEGEALDLPSYDADDVVLTWNDVVVRGKISEGQPREKLNFFDPPVFLVREKTAKYSLDLNDDGVGDVAVKSLKEPTEFTRKGPAGESRYAIRLTTFGDKEAFQRAEVNLAPSDSFVKVGYRSVGFLGGELRGQPIRVFDLNCDGRYGADPAPITMDVIEGEPEVRFDAIQIGKGTRPLPASSVIELEGKLYRLRFDAEGGKPTAKLRELAVPTAVLKMEHRGPATAKPAHLVVRETGEFS
ncbi:MAG TPA: tetratricopeptide repeat protein, partial [Planctomycetota bacterium]|nr:tetratricopeptide repeat protein [Planctomycetota bacterium]